MARAEARLFPALLRHWRMRRGYSQLDFALLADVSARHLSFLETGRAEPSREMILRLAAALDVPLRERNTMLRAAGHADEYPEPALAAGLPAGVAQAIERMLAQHEPYPMIVLDRRYDIVRTNAAAGRLMMRFVAEPAALGTPPNAFTMLFDPRLVRPFVVDWERTAHELVSRLHRESLIDANAAVLAPLLDSLFEYPDVPREWRQPDFSVPSEPTIVLRFRRGDVELAFLTTMTVFSAPQNVTLDELTLESYFPVDPATAELCQRLAT